MILAGTLDANEDNVAEIYALLKAAVDDVIWPALRARMADPTRQIAQVTAAWLECACFLLVVLRVALAIRRAAGADTHADAARIIKEAEVAMVFDHQRLLFVRDHMATHPATTIETLLARLGDSGVANALWSAVESEACLRQQHDDLTHMAIDARCGLAEDLGLPAPSVTRVPGASTAPRLPADADLDDADREAVHALADELDFTDDDLASTNAWLSEAIAAATSTSTSS
jgi:hypothetical protein